VADVVQEGQQVEAKVLSVDPENQRISLSIKVLGPPPEAAKKTDDDRSGNAGSSPADAGAGQAKKKERKVPLQGGLGRSPLGDKFGLKW
ncbi:MAG TPA: S1 RNA-binding domain-containing protein, partial [Pirellulales bacterium]